MMFDIDHTFVTSDHHFGSYKLPSFLQVYTESQEQELIEKWNSIVGKDDIVVVGSDFGTATLECLEKGEIGATVVDDPYMMGYQSLLQLFAAAHPTDILSSTAPYGHISTSDILFSCSLVTAEDYTSNEQLREKFTNLPTFD